MFGCRIWKLHQDCDEIFKKDSPSTNGVENSSSKSNPFSTLSPILVDELAIMGLLICVIRCSQ
jgi:hypothetical protein